MEFDKETNISSSSSLLYTNSTKSADLTTTTTIELSFDFIINGIGIPIIVFLGIIGNSLSAIVLSQPQMKSSVSCLLLGLAFCDTLLITTAFLIFGLPSICNYTGWFQIYQLIYYPLYVPYLFPISITAQTCSIYLTLALTIERYIVVCYPLHAKVFCTWRRAFYCVVGIIFISCVYNLPRWFEVCIRIIEYVDDYGHNEMVSDGDDGQVGLNITKTLYINEMCAMRNSSLYKSVYINWLYLIIMYLIPFNGLVIFNWTIYKQIRKASLQRQIMSKLERRELSLATMLLFVVCVFLLCNVLPLVNNILESFYNFTIDQLVIISNFLVVVNSSVNFVIYCSCGEKFRKQLLRLLKWNFTTSFIRSCYCCNRNGFNNGQIIRHSLGNGRIRTLSSNGSSRRKSLGNNRNKSFDGTLSAKHQKQQQQQNQSQKKRRKQSQQQQNNTHETSFIII